jgi:hypothetical protein
MTNYMTIHKKLMQRYIILLIVLSTCAEGQVIERPDAAQAHIFLNERERAHDDPSGSVLVPSFVVNDILSKMDQYEREKNEFLILAKTYMNGYSKELAQIITQNNVGSYATNRVAWFRYGAEDATKYVESMAKSGAKVSYDLLARFGYQKIEISGAYTILHQLEYGRNVTAIQVYAPKSIEDELENAILTKKVNVKVNLVGWLSPLGYYDAETGRLPRMLVVESGSLQK